MKTKKELISNIDAVISFAVPPMNNEQIGKFIDEVNKSNNTDIRITDIPCMRSQVVSNADVRPEKDINGAAVVIGTAFLSIAVNHLLNPDEPKKKMMLLAGITIGALTLSEPLTEIGRRKSGSALLSMIGSGIGTLGTLMIRIYK